MNHPIINRALVRINQGPVAQPNKSTKIRSVNRQSNSKWLLGIPLLFSRKLNVWDAQRGKHVYTSVSKSKWKKVKEAAANEDSLAHKSQSSLQLRKKLALEIIRKTGQAQGLTVLDRASPHQLCLIARQLARYGHNTEYRDAIFTELRKAQNQWQALSMDPQTLSMVDGYVKGGQKLAPSSQPSVRYAQGVQFTNGVAKPPVLSDSQDFKEKFPDRFRKFVADLISVDERDRDQDGSSPERLQRLKEVFDKNVAIVTALDTKAAMNSTAELAKSCGVEVGLIATIIAVARQSRNQMFSASKQNSSSNYLLDQISNSIGSYEALAESLDESIVQYRYSKLPEIGEQLSKHIPQKEGNFGKFLNQIFQTYFQNLPDNDVRAVMASGLREADINDPAERHLVATLKGSGPYMLKILQLMGDSVDTSTDDGIKLKKALGELKDQLLPISSEIQVSMLNELVEKSNPRIRNIVDVKPLGAASVGQTFLATVNFESGQQQSVVIKLLKPGVDQRAARERTWMDGIAKKHAGMEETFAGIADQIDRELDLSREADNVNKAKVYREAGLATLQSVKNVTGIAATQENMFMELAPGNTVKAQLDELNASLKDLDPEKFQGKQLDPQVRIDCQDALGSAQVLSERLHGLAGVWLKEALFGSGFYHGDLHGGNMMFDKQAPNSPLTLIDFGNAGTLTRAERANILKLILASEFKYPEVFIDTLGKLLGPQSQALLNNPATKEKLVAEVTRLCQNSSLSGSKRMLEAFNVANTLDIAIPNVISNFARSQNMLEMAINDVNSVIKTSTNVLNAGGYPPEVAPQPSPLSETLRTTVERSKKQILLLTSKEGWEMRKENVNLPQDELLISGGLSGESSDILGQILA